MPTEKNLDVLSLRLPADLRDAIKDLAYKADRSPSEYVRYERLHLVRRAQCPEVSGCAIRAHRGAGIGRRA